MSRQPLNPKDICRVVGGQGQRKSPNLGKTVTVVRRMIGNHGDDHSVYGPIYRCEGPGIMQLGDAGNYVEMGWADFAADWLLKIEPDALLPEGTTTEIEAPHLTTA